MPTYEYICTNCKKVSEARQGINDEPLKECPHCHQLTLQRGIGGGAATLRFTGSGFYITDYKDEQKKSCPPGGCGKKDCQD